MANERCKLVDSVVFYLGAHGIFSAGHKVISTKYEYLQQFFIYYQVLEE